MTDKGRAAVNVRHLRHGDGNAKGKSGTTGDRQRLLEEMMRELEEKWAQHHAKKNPNIVLSETHLNDSFMFDPDTGGWKTPKCVEEVVAYGDDRAARVGRKIGATSFETTTLVVHLPRTLCTEVPGYYPVYTEDGQIKYDKELRRSRWVARDQAEANRYLIQATEWLADNVLPGGREAVHGFNVQHDESTPHVQIMADTFAEHPDKPGVLRVEASQAWGSHRDVRYPEGHPQAGQQMGGNQKMRMYQQGLRQYMHGLGYEVELDVSERAHESLDKDRYAAEDNARRSLEADQQTLEAEQKALESDREKYTADAAVLGTAQKNFANNVASFQADLEKFRVARNEVEADMSDVMALADKLEELQKELEHRESVVADQENAVKAEKSALPELKRRAQVEGYEVGKTEGLPVAQEAAEKIRMQAASDAQRTAQQAIEAAQRVRQEAEDETEQKRQQAEIDAQTIRNDAERVKAHAEAVRGAADMTMTEAKDALDEAQELLHTAQEITPPQIDEIEFKRQMNTVDADFLGQLCEKNPKIAQNRENYRDRRRRQMQWGTPEQQAALDHTVGQAQELARKRFGVRPGSPESPKPGRQHGNGPEY